MTDRDRWGLRGPVQSCRHQRFWYAGRCGADRCDTEERGDTTLVEFHPDGSLARRWHHNPDGSESTTVYTYDDSCRLTSVPFENTAGLIDVQRYEYDSAGRLIRVVARAPDGSDRIAERYEYDASGRKQKTAHVDVTVQNRNTLWGVEGTDSAYSAPGAATLITLHNTRDQPTELIFSDKDGRTLSRVAFLYDDMGHLVEEAQTVGADMFPPAALAGLSSAQLGAMRALAAAGPVRRLYRYDARGHRVETHDAMFGRLVRHSQTMTYNDHGDQIEDISEHDHRAWSIDDQGRLCDGATTEKVSRSEARLHYDYDKRGNWIEKVVEARGGPELDSSVSSIEHRILAYYD